MALDSRNKRASALGGIALVYPEPDGTLSAADRRQIMRLYAGTLARTDYVFPLSVSHSVAAYAITHSVPTYSVAHSVPTYSVSHSVPTYSVSHSVPTYSVTHTAS